MGLTTEAIGAYASSMYQAAGKNAAGKTAAGKTADAKKEAVEKVKEAATGGITDTKEYGKTIGDAKLSEAGKKYYDQLKAKYGNLDFVLVSKDMKEQAKAHASSYGNKDKMVVLVDDEKIEKMATDENFRKKYEGLIAQASTQMPEMKAKFGGDNSIKAYGMQVNDNGAASFFAVVSKNADAAAKAQEKRIAAKKAANKEAAKKAEKKAAEKKAEEKRAEKAAEAREAEDVDEADDIGDDDIGEDGDYEIIMARSAEELYQKVADYQFNQRSNSVLSDAEKQVGQSLDLKI